MRHLLRSHFTLIALVLGFALILHACAPRLQAVGPPVGEPALNGTEIVTADGASLPLRAWLPDTAPRAVILGLHGFNDYGNAFAIPAESWNADGVAVYAYDQRGFGATDERGLWPGVDALVDDLATVAALVRERHSGVPLYVVGVSMGGAVAMAALARGRLPEVSGTVLVGPAVWGRETMPIGHRVLLWVASHTLPWHRVSGRGLDITPSDNIEMLRALGADPLVIKETRIDAIHGLVDLMDLALASAPTLQSPLLVLYGRGTKSFPKNRPRPCSASLSRHAVLRSTRTAITCCCATCRRRWSTATSPPGSKTPKGRCLRPPKTRRATCSTAARRGVARAAPNHGHGE